MRSLTLAAGAAAIAFMPSIVSAAVYTVGGPLSELCYQSAVSRDARDTSLDACTRALQEEALATPDRAATLVNRGILNMIHGHSVDADADFDGALAINRDLADAWLNKGFLRLRNGQGKDALPLLQEGINRGPQRQALAIFARGVAYEQMGRYDLAYADLRRAHQLEPPWSLPSEYLARYGAGAR